MAIQAILLSWLKAVDVAMELVRLGVIAVLLLITALVFRAGTKEIRTSDGV